MFMYIMIAASIETLSKQAEIKIRIKLLVYNLKIVQLLFIVKEKGQTMIYKTPHRKPQIEQH